MSAAFAIASGVVGVGSAVTGAVKSSQAAGKAAADAAAAGKKLNKKQQQALAQYTQSLGQVQAPQWDIKRDIEEGIRINREFTIPELENMFPGAKTQREIASRATESMLRGEIPRDVQEQIMRSVAELGGAGFQPSAAPTGVPAPSGFQAAQGLLSRQLGMTSLELQQAGNEMSMRWQNLLNSFLERGSPLQVGQARLGFEKAAADIQMRKAEGLFGAQTGVAQSQYDVAQSNIANRLAADQALISGIQSVGSSLSGAIGGIGSAYNQLRAARAGSTTPLKSGFYAGELGAARAANVAPSQISYQKGEGFYYNPAGPFGRADIPRSIVYGGG